MVGEDGVASSLLRLDAAGRPQGAPVRVGSGELTVLSDVVANGAVTTAVLDGGVLVELSG